MTISFLSRYGYNDAAGAVPPPAIHFIPISITSCTFFGGLSIGSSIERKRCIFAFAILHNIDAIIVLVLIAISIDPDASPKTTTGCSISIIYSSNFCSDILIKVSTNSLFSFLFFNAKILFINSPYGILNGSSVCNLSIVFLR